METTFVKILNRSLVVLCLILLVTTIGMLAAAVLNFSNSFAPTVNDAVVVPVTTFSDAQAQRRAQQSSPLAESEPVSPLYNAALAMCRSKSGLIKLMTDGRLSLSDLDACSKGAIETSRTFGVRDLNYLNEARRHYLELAKDPKTSGIAKTLEADTMSKALDAMTNRFNVKFSTVADQLNELRAKRELAAAEHRLLSYWAAGIAAAAFIAFLVIAFLMVVVRIEKHLQRIADRTQPSR